MNYIHHLLQKMGTLGIVVSYLVSLVFVALLYFGVIADELLESSTRPLASIVLFTFFTYQLFNQLRSIKNLDTSLFFSYPLTTLAEIDKNAEANGIKAFYIGKVKYMGRFSDWNAIAKHLKSAVNLKQSYDPNVRLKENTSVTDFLPADNVLGIRYSNELYQFTQLRSVSNDLHVAIQLIARYQNAGIRVDGDYEKLKETSEQFTPRHWLKMALVISVVTISFAIISVFVAGTYFT